MNHIKFNFKILLILLLLVSSSKCKKDASEQPCACNIQNPQENVEWLKNILDRVFCAEIYTINFEGKEYIGVSDCAGVADGMIVFYDCKGEKVCEWGGIGSGGSSCFMPTSFTHDYFEKNKKLIFRKQKT